MVYDDNNGEEHEVGKHNDKMALGWPYMVDTHVFIRASHREIVLSALPVQSRFDCGIHWTTLTASACPRKVWRHLPYSTSQIRAVASNEPDATTSSVSWKHTLQQPSVWPRKTCRQLFYAKLHNFTVLSPDAVASMVPWVLNCTSAIQLWWALVAPAIRLPAGNAWSCQLPSSLQLAMAGLCGCKLILVIANEWAVKVLRLTHLHGSCYTSLSLFYTGISTGVFSETETAAAAVLHVDCFERSSAGQTNVSFSALSLRGGRDDFLCTLHNLLFFRLSNRVDFAFPVLLTCTWSFLLVSTPSSLLLTFALCSYSSSL